MEVTFFIFDKNLDPVEFKKQFDIEGNITYIPCFYSSTLYVYKNFCCIFDDFKKRNKRLTFGSLIKVDIDEPKLREIDTYYTIGGFNKKKDILVTPIGIESISEFLKGKFKIFKKERCVSYVLDMSTERGNSIRKNRHMGGESFHRKFLLIYKKK